MRPFLPHGVKPGMFEGEVFLPHRPRRCRNQELPATFSPTTLSSPHFRGLPQKKPHQTNPSKTSFTKRPRLGAFHCTDLSNMH
jgi:hypothetical protein